MAGEVPPLIIEATLNASGVAIGVGKVKSELAQASVAAEETGAKFKTMGTSMIGAFAGMAVVAGAVALLRGSVKAAEDAQVATVQLGTAMNNARVNTEANRAAVEKSAHSMENLGFKTTESEAALGKLITTTGSVAESQHLLSLAADLARVKHESLTEAAMVLSRATTGSARAFREFGIVLDTHLPKNQAIAKAMDELNKKIGGQAQANTKTFAGQMEVMGAKMTDVKDIIGGALIPILSMLASTFSAVLDFLKPILPALTLFIIAITAIIAAVKIWSLVVKAYTAVQAALNAVLAANPIMLVVAAIGLLVVGFIAAWQHSEAFRRIVVDVMQAIVRAVGWVLGAVGELAMAFIKFETGPLTLILKALSHLPFVGGAAKSALKEMGHVTQDVGDFFDKAKAKVDNFANGMDSMVVHHDKAKKSLLETGGGQSNADPLGIEGLVPGGSVAKGASKAAAAAAKHLATIKTQQDNIKKLYDQEAIILKDRQDKMDAATQTHTDAMQAAQDTYNQRSTDLQRVHTEALASIQQTFDDAETSAKANHQDTLERLDKDYAQKKIDLTTTFNDNIAKINEGSVAKALALETSAADKRKSIIQSSIDALTNIWATATKIDIGSLFKSNSSAGGLVSGMKAQLDAILKLQKDAGLLAAGGYSQSFIQEVLKQGPAVGDQMAQAILNATPDTQNQIKSLYGQIETTSATGLDSLAAQMSDGTKFATEAMTDAYAQVAVTLQKSLADNQALLATDLAKENTVYTLALAGADKAYKDAVIANDTTLSDALAKAVLKQTESTAKANQTLNDGLATSARTLADSLTKSQDAFTNAIQAISDATMKQLDALQAKIATTSAKITSLGGAVPVNTNALPVGLTPFTPKIVAPTGGSGDPRNPQLTGSTATTTAATTSAAPSVSVTVNGTTLVDPAQTASTIISYLKFHNMAG
jgi:hypothetical protein